MPRARRTVLGSLFRPWQTRKNSPFLSTRVKDRTIARAKAGASILAKTSARAKGAAQRTVPIRIKTRNQTLAPHNGGRLGDSMWEGRPRLRFLYTDSGRGRSR